MTADPITAKWAAWAEAAEEYAKAACIVEQGEARRAEGEARLREAAQALGCDPLGLIKEPPR